MSTVRMRATWIVEYDADVEQYGAATPQEAAQMDQETDDPVALMVDADTVSFTVEPISA